MPSRRPPEEPPSRGPTPYSYEPPPRCGRPTLLGPPCPRPPEMGEGCRFHATDEERAAHAQEEAREQEREARRAARKEGALQEAARRAETRRREERRTAGCCSVFVLAVLGLLGAWGWSAVQNYDRERACAPHRDQANRLDDKARSTSVPLVSPFDPAVSGLQLKKPDLSQEASEGLTELNTPVTSAEIADAYSNRWAVANQAATEVLNNKGCFNDWERQRATQIRNAPSTVSSVTMPEAARCVDGWPSSSIGRQGACSHHGGVAPATFWAVLNF